MNIQTSRFGSVEVNKEDIVTFPEGVLGFAHLRDFVILDDPNDEIFVWLQSCEQSEVAFPLLEPSLFSQGYAVSLTKRDRETLSLQEGQSFHIFSVVTIPEDPTQMTANLKAPVIINDKNKIGRQCVLQDNKLAIRESIFTRLQQRFVQTPSMKPETKGFSVRLSLSPRTEA